MRRRPGVAWIVFAIAVLLAIIGVLTVIAIFDRWDANRVNAFAAWATGLLTLAGVSLALFEAATARRDAERARLEAEVDAARREWEVERQRRIALEIQRRSEGMQACTYILDALSDVTIRFAEMVKDAAFHFDDRERRVQLGLDADLMWRRAVPNMGARLLPINTSGFARTLSQTTVPKLQPIFDRTDVFAEAETTSELLALLNDIGDALQVGEEELRKCAVDDFTLSMDRIVERVDAEYPAFREP